MKISTWDEAIVYLNGLDAPSSSEHLAIIKQRVELSHRSAELFQTIQAIAALDPRAEDPGLAIEWPGSSIAQPPVSKQDGELAQEMREIKELLRSLASKPP